MRLSPGSQLGPYQIVGHLGAGGMGEVYRAHDTRLQRDVAIKILPAGLGADPAALARFEREAQAVAALSHPNILSIHDAGQADGIAYAVAELLEGRNLREALNEGPLSPRKALEVALQIAHGLAAAHDRGIVHRDLKPENVFVTSDGRVKILDFGLAQMETTVVDSQQTTIALAPAPGTAPGMVFGTVGYMAPEQVRGVPVDARTDIFAFGAVLYEMLCGRRAFAGDTPADTMSAILRADPPDLLIREPAVPPAVDRIVRRCLEKQPAERFQSARDLAFALEAVSSGSTGPLALSGPRRRDRLPRAAAAVGLLATGAFLGWLAGLWLTPRSPAPPLAARFAIPSALGLPPWVAVSPDGGAITWAAVAARDNTNRMWIRRLTDNVPRVLEQTASVSAAAWLNDSRRLLVVRGPQMVVFDTETGSQAVFREATDEDRKAPLRGLAVGPGDAVLLGAMNGIVRLEAGGGQQWSWVRRLEGDQHTWLGYPQWLPDGRRVLYVASRADRTGVDTFVADMAGGEATRVDLPSGLTGVLVDPEGFVVYGLGGTLRAQRFDFDRLATVGESVELTTDLLLDQRSGFLAASLAPTGVLVYRTLAFAHVQFEWADRSGRPIRGLGPVDTFTNFDLSPDARRVVVTRRETETVGNSLWMIDDERGTTTRLADTRGGSISDPTWSPDGQRIAYRRGSRLVVRGTFGGEEAVLADRTGYPDSWTSDGRYLTVGRPVGNNYELWVVRTDGIREEIPVVQGLIMADEPRFSPDGRWIVYHAAIDETPQVYAVPFPPTGERWQLSARGGVQPRWRADGLEIFYLDLDGMMTSVSIPGGDPRRARPPEPLFRTTLEPSQANDQFGVTPDGQRFILRRPIGESSADQAPLTVIVNWRELVP